jgi:tetratricopeptide (TPR) repeat protein
LTARAEDVLGFVQKSMTHYQQALQLCPEDDLKDKATTLHNIAELKAQQGDVDETIALYQQSWDIYESINNAQGMDSDPRLLKEVGDLVLKLIIQH